MPMRDRKPQEVPVIHVNLNPIPFLPNFIFLIVSTFRVQLIKNNLTLNWFDGDNWRAIG